MFRACYFSSPCADLHDGELYAGGSLELLAPLPEDGHGGRQGGTLVLRKQVFFFDISKNVRGIYEILCAARYMSNELIFQISASWVIGKHPGGKFCEMQFLQCKMTQIGHFQGMIKRVSRGCLMVSIILTRQDMSIFR